MEKHNFVTIADLSKDKILYLIKMAQEFENIPIEILKGPVSLLFSLNLPR